MDHPLTAAETLRPWRTAAVVAVTIAAIELVLLLVIGGGSLFRTVSDRVDQAAAKRAAQAQAKPENHVVTRKPATTAATLPRTKVRVVVLNGNGRQGAAAAAAARVQGRGYKIGLVGNAPRSDFPRSIVMYKPGFGGEGKRLARDLGVKLVTPLDGMRTSELRGAHLVYILGS